MSSSWEEISAVNEADRASTWTGQNGGQSEVLPEAGFLYGEDATPADDKPTGTELLNELLEAAPPYFNPPPQEQAVDPDALELQQWRYLEMINHGNERLKNLDAHELRELVDEATRRAVIRRFTEST